MLSLTCDLSLAGEAYSLHLGVILPTFGSYTPYIYKSVHYISCCFLRVISPWQARASVMLQPSLGAADTGGGDTALGWTMLHCTALYYTALHCNALHCTALH